MNTARRRVPRSCTECARRKVKCQKEYPCEACIRRGEPQKCVVPDTYSLSEIERERVLVQDRISVMQNYAADPLLCSSSSPQDSPEDLLVMLESLSHGRAPSKRQPDDPIGIHHLYHPVQQVVLMLLPDRPASEALVRFSLGQLSWLHCGVRTGVFWGEHQAFWDAVERGEMEVLKQHDWMALYLSILASAYLYMNAEERPPLERLADLQSSTSPGRDTADPGLSIARTWSEAALDELDASRPLAHPNLRTVQTFAILTLCHGNFGQMDREYLLLGMAINTARCLNMHLLAHESNFPPHLRQSPEWSTPESRQMGRRLWWILVVCDWLGMLSRPSSISLTSFNTSLAPSASDAELLFPDTTTSTTTYSPLWHLQVISRLALIIYSNIKAPRDLDVSKLARAAEQIEAILHQVSRQTSTHLAPHAPLWVQHQHYLALYTIHFLRLTVARANLVRWLKDQSQPRSTVMKGVHAALEILRMSEKPLPPLIQRSWIICAATLASGVFLAVHLISFKSTFAEDQIAIRRQVIRYSATAVRALDAHTHNFSVQGPRLLEQLLVEEASCHSWNHINKEALVRILEEVETRGPAYSYEEVPGLYPSERTDINQPMPILFGTGEGETGVLDMGMGPEGMICDPFMGEMGGLDGVGLDYWSQSPGDSLPGLSSQWYEDGMVAPL